MNTRHVVTLVDMYSLRSELNVFLINTINKLYPKLPDKLKEKIRIEKGKTSDYQFSYSVAIAKALGLETDVVCKEIVLKLGECELIEEVTMSGTPSNPYINIMVSMEKLLVRFNKMYHVVGEWDYRNATKNGKTVLVDYSSPNIAKEMHVGHLRSTIIGESICRLHEFVGYDVQRINHLGDWGTQFGMLIAYLKKNSIGEYTLSDLMHFYRESKKLFDADADFKKDAHNETVLLQKGDETNRNLWTKICMISQEGFEAIYDKLNVHIQVQGESFYQSRMEQLITDLGDSLLDEKGMKVIFPTGMKVPFIIQKSDGGFTYDTSDLTALKYRIQEVGTDKIVYVVDLSQQEHFKQLFQIATDLDLNLNKQTALCYAGFGMVLGADGKKLKTRSGDTVRLQDLLDQAEEQALKVTKQIASERHQDWSEEQIQTTASIIAISSIKYADLSRTEGRKL